MLKTRSAAVSMSQPLQLDAGRYETVRLGSEVVGPVGTIDTGASTVQVLGQTVLVTGRGNASVDGHSVVRAAIEKLGYVPNLMAGGLSSRRSRMVAAIVPTMPASAR